ncbi:HET-domain-containing protein [Tothia fuscella]|uniref:HET-domain-containing protein n=1 Tax=Tothia fuscella TaxID=1048955 RepID=A0A9P4TV42_9PEZI|nr:HET-domain-containing protein [Tothia fuscella]
MTLLNTETLELKEFFGSVIPEYVILSHTWGSEVVTFQELQVQGADTLRKAGYMKIRACCTKAASDGYTYAWIDTCCIDKTSSAELSEAINSMYEWYKKANICYALLQDVPSSKSVDLNRSKWFTRSWTLQELLAPAVVEFYAADWQEIGTKSTLSAETSRITSISVEVLLGSDMSKQATRIEDGAYCLLGIFQFNMPLLYGEGRRSFHRLQEEILKTSEDYTLFAWLGCASNGTDLCSWPSEFRYWARKL